MESQACRVAYRFSMALQCKQSIGNGVTPSLAEEVGFEPTVPEGTTVFKTAAFDHSATPPYSTQSPPSNTGKLGTADGKSSLVRDRRPLAVS